MDKLQTMQLVTEEDYRRFLERRVPLRIGGTVVNLRGNAGMLRNLGPGDYLGEDSTVWSFSRRGDWATHKGDYPGNWSPYVPRNLISRFSSRGELVLDSMMGSGTTLVECRLLDRRAVGVDINRDAVMLAHDRLNFGTRISAGAQSLLFWGDARNLDALRDNSVDLVATHPPYAGIIRYGQGVVQGDLSDSASIADYLSAIGLVASECCRVLKPGRHCAILVGDTRVHAHYVPIAFMVMIRFLDAGFILKENVIKVQHNTSSDRGKWAGPRPGFYKIAHEHLFVFRKPAQLSELEELRLSCRLR